MAQDIISKESLQQTLVQALGAERVLTGEDDLAFYSGDIFGGNCIASLIIGYGYLAGTEKPCSSKKRAYPGER